METETLESIAEPVLETVVEVAEEKKTHILVGLAIVGGGVLLIGFAGHLVGKRYDRWKTDRRQLKAQIASNIKA